MCSELCKHGHVSYLIKAGFINNVSQTIAERRRVAEIRSHGYADGMGYSSFWQPEYEFCRKLVCSIVLIQYANGFSLLPLFFPCSLLRLSSSFYSLSTKPCFDGKRSSADACQFRMSVRSWKHGKDSQHWGSQSLASLWVGIGAPS